MESVDLKMIRRFAMSKRWMLAFVKGLTVEQRAYVCREGVEYDTSLTGEGHDGFLCKMNHV